jgi:hypothetical protein
LTAIAAYVIWGRVESHRLSRDVEAIRQRGEPIDLADWQKPPDTDERRRAARLYADAADRAQEKARDQGYRFSRLDVDRIGSTAADLAELETTYRKDTPALQLLDQATPLDFTGFGPVAPELDGDQSPLVMLGALNCLRADFLSKHGQGDAAATALVASVRLQRAIPTSEFQYSFGSRLWGSLRILLRHTAPGETSLLALQRAFEQMPDEDGLARQVMRRRAQFLEAFNGPRRGLAETVIFAAFRPAITHVARRQLAAFDEVIAVARQPWPEKLEAADALRRRLPGPEQRRTRGWLRNLVEQGPPWMTVAPLHAETAGLDLAVRRSAITVLALERYRRAHAGAPPPTLDALVPAFMTAVAQDPFSGRPLVYKQEAGSYIVYSIDANRVDDGGVLYGLGAMAVTGPRGSQSPRDFGIRVPLKKQ